MIVKASDIPLAIAAAQSVAMALGLAADDATVLQESNRLTLRLLPCDVLARVAPVAQRDAAEFEVEVARRLAENNSPVAVLEPRVEPHAYVHGEFVVTLWTYYKPVSPRDITPAEYAEALARLHAGMRRIDLPAPHFTDRVAEAERLISNRDQTPELPAVDRAFLAHSFKDLGAAIARRGAPEQLLHGEPHSGNLLRTKQGLPFIDLETCCRGPVEFDIAHCARLGDASWLVDAETPGAVGAHYPGADPELIRECWTLMLGMVAAWRWDRLDQFPDGRRMGIEFVRHMRVAMERFG